MKHRIFTRRILGVLLFVAALMVAASAGAQTSFTNIAQMVAFNASTLREGMIANVSGYQVPGDGGEGRFMYSPASASTTNATRIIAATPSGRWFRLEADWMHPEWAGVLANGVTDDTYNLQRAIDSTESNAKLVLPHGNILVVSNVVVTRPICIEGHPLGSTILVSAAFPADQDVLVFRPATRYQQLQLRNFAILPAAGTPGRHGIVFDTKTADTAWSDCR